MNPIDQAMSEAVRGAYRRGQEEETMEPLCRVDDAGQPVGRIQDGDFVVFYDIRGEREVELTEAFVRPRGVGFPVDPELAVNFATMIEYDAKLPVKVAFPPERRLKGTLVEAVSRAGRRVVKVTETEKAIHLAYFLNGKQDVAFPGETRVAPPSPHDPFAEPEMRSEEIADALIAAVADPGAALVVGNLPNMDVVGHGEDKAAILRAIAAVDRAVGRILAVCRRAGVTALVTADHGSVEHWLYPEGTIDTGHTTSPVPFVYAPPDGSRLRLRRGGSLADVAPTALQLLGIDPPAEMTGRSLFVEAPPRDPARRVLLLVCDGWGLAEPGPGNLLSQAEAPHLRALLAERSWTELAASGLAVGLPEGTVGNSEAGHLHIGAGRVVSSDRVRIARAIEDGSFYENEAFRWAVEGAKRERTRLHLLGIVSFFSSHGSIEHLFALLELARRAGAQDVFVHGLLGRRGERPESGAHYVGEIERKTAELGVGRLVSVIGRHWALDRERNWDRVERTYRLLVDGVGRPVH